MMDSFIAWYFHFNLLSIKCGPIYILEKHALWAISVILWQLGRLGQYFFPTITSKSLVKSMLLISKCQPQRFVIVFKKWVITLRPRGRVILNFFMSLTIYIYLHTFNFVLLCLLFVQLMFLVEIIRPALLHWTFLKYSSSY